jgi:hypothetical protein
MEDTTQAPEGIIPFYCGSQYQDWMWNNCHQCARYNADEFETINRGCDIEEALFNCSWGVEPLSPEMARRMGFILADGTETDAHCWRCPEYAATPEVLEEERRRADFAAHPVLPGLEIVR